MLRGRHIDYVMLGVMLLLVVFGLVMLASASSDLGKQQFDDSYHYLVHQIKYGLSFGIIGFLFGALFPYKHFRKFAFVLLLLSMALLILVLFPNLGVSSGIAQRWLTLGPITFQPSELLKLTFITYMAAWLSGSEITRQSSFSEGFLPFLGISGLTALLLLLQNSTSAMIILMLIAIIMYFVSGGSKKFIVAAVILGIIALGVMLLVSNDYRIDRIKTFISSESDPSGSGYQINQALTTIGSGGLFGVGYGQSNAKQYLPERIGDSIFAIIAEEWGFIGSAAFILLFLALTIRGFIIAKRSRDRFGKLLMTGFTALIGLQSFIHIASISGIIPLTGVPLPFISFGGTALAVFLLIGGIMINISRHAPSR